MLMLAASTVFSACGVRCELGADSPLQERLEKGFSEAVHHPGTPIRISEIAGFTFDRLYVIGAYLSGKQTESIIGTTWQCSSGTGMEWQDDRAMFVFVKNGQVIKYAYCSVRYGGFETHLLQGLTAEQAILTVKEPAPGDTYITVLEPPAATSPAGPSGPSPL